MVLCLKETTLFSKHAKDLLIMFNVMCLGGIFALRAHCALLLDYVPRKEPPSTPLGNALRIR